MRTLSGGVSLARHAVGALAEAAVLGAIVAALIFALAPVSAPADALAGTGQAAAAKGGGKPTGGGSTLQLVMLDGGNATANHRERAAFNVSTTATDRPFVGVRCYQGANFVLDGYTGYFPSYLYDPWVTLDSSSWVAGVQATCSARLFYFDKRGNQKVLATLDFPAAP